MVVHIRALACTLALAALASCPSTAAAEPPGRPTRGAFGMLGQTVLAAIASSTNAGQALGALGESLAMLEARRRVERRASRPSQPPPTPDPKPATPADPSSMPPASAGSNGTTTPLHDAATAGRIFAHVPAGGSESPAILLTGIALAPPDAPEAVQGAINAANTIVGRPYVWGGGHGSFYSNGYDCSGSVSFALFGGGLIPRPLTSSELEHWGAPGPGRWITVYANGGHTFAEIAGLRWDTVGDAQGTGPRWHLAPTSTAGFVVRHPPGY